MGTSSSLPPFDQVVGWSSLQFDQRADDQTKTFDATVGRHTVTSAGPTDRSGPQPGLAVIIDAVRRGAGAPDGTDFQVTELIGRGGMGEVWLARQRSLGRDVALKTTQPDADAHVEQALIAEARITGALEHPSIVPVHALGRAASGQPVLVMKRIEGVVWRDLLRSPDHPHWTTFGPEAPLVVHVQVLMQLCNALELAHRRGFVHRDIKPANVMVGSFGEVYLVDWGLAIEAGRPPREPRQLEGTPAYMAPEMIAGLPVDARTDVYLLGATLHEILTGTPPHAGDSIVEVLKRGYESAAHDYGAAPSELAALCQEAMSREAASRPPGARAFRDRLAAYLRHRTSSAIVRRGRELIDRLGLPGTTAEHRRALLEECLVTLRLALSEWPDSPAALAALDDWRRIAVAIEVDEGHLAAAERLLAQIDQPAPELLASVDALRARLARERDEADRGRRAAFERDVGIGARERRWLGAVLAACIAVVAMFSIPRSLRHTLDAREILLFALVPFVPFLVAVTLLRRRLLGNAFARQTVALMGVMFALILAHRTVAWLASYPPDETLAAELLMVAGVCGVGGVVLARWWFAGLVAGLSGALVSTWQPGLAGLAFTSTALLVAFAGVVSWSRDVRAGERDRAAMPSPDA